MAEQIQDAHEAGLGADAAKARGTPEPSPPTPAPPAEAVPAVSHSVKDASLADRLADWGLPSVLKGIHHELDMIGRIHKYDWISKRLLVLRNVIIASALVVVTVLVVVISYRELSKDVLVIGGFDVPATLEQRGFSSRVMGKKLFDQLTYIRTQTLTKLPKKDIVPSVWKAEADVAIPETKLTVGSLFAYIRGLLGRDTYVDGELTEQDQQVAVTVRIRGKPHQTVTGTISELDALMQKAAEHIMLETHPYVVAQFRYFKNDLAGSLQAVLASAQSNNPVEVADALQLWGQLLAATGDQPGAMAKWEESLLASPSTSRALTRIIQELRRQGRRDEVMKRLQQRTASYPNESFAWAELASISIDEGDDVAAARFNKTALAMNPYDANAMFNESQLLEDRDPVAAVAVGERMERAVTLTQDPWLRALALAAKVNSLVNLREYDQAKLVTEKFIAADPLDYQGYYRLAHVLAPMHDYDAAIAAANKAIAMGSRSAHIMLARALLAKGDLDAAWREAEVNLKSFPRYAEMIFGNIHLKRKQPAAAAKSFRSIIARSPDRAVGHIGLGRALAAQGDTKGAEQEFKKAIALGPKFGDPHYYWGEMLAANGDHAGAIAKYQQAIALHPKWGEPYAKWGESLKAQGDLAGAKEKFAKALELEPKHPGFQKYNAVPK